jgi:hypothetical protein
MSEKKLYWETNTPNSDSDYTVFKTLEDAREAIHDYLDDLFSNTLDKEAEADGFKINLYIKPFKMTEDQFKKICKEAL